MPATSIRDLVIKDDDIVVGTHGRSFWILDDITPLRQITLKTNQSVILYKPQTAIRVRWDMWTDTPLPQEEPAGQNPPDGAIIDYCIIGNAKEVSLEISDSKGNIIRRYSSTDKTYEFPALNIPLYWIRPQTILSGKPGSHRFTWDMHYPPLSISPSYPIAATYMNTEIGIKMDPRVKTSLVDLQKQHDLSMQCYEGRKECMQALKDIAAFRNMLKGQMTNPSPTVADKLNKLDEQAKQLENTAQGSEELSFGRLNNSFASIFNVLQDSDMPPTMQTVSAVAEAQRQLQLLRAKWNELKNKK